MLPCGTVVELLLMCHSDSIFRVNDRLITSVCACVCVRYSIFNRFVVRVLWDAWTLAQPVKSMLENFCGTGRWEGQVHLGSLQDQLLPVYCCTKVLSYEDNNALTCDSNGTEAHPTTYAILFQCCIRAHHMTSVSCLLPTFREFGRHSWSQGSIMI